MPSGGDSILELYRRYAFTISPNPSPMSDTLQTQKKVGAILSVDVPSHHACPARSSSRRHRVGWFRLGHHHRMVSANLGSDIGLREDVLQIETIQKLTY
jgi:hypothetical protein